MLRSCLGLLVVACLAGVTTADEPAKGEQKEITKESKISKDGKKCSCRACSVNLRKELGVPLDYLTGLGLRIHQARLSPDPVDLALAAQSLAVAERISGKKASVTSDEVMGEALKLAKMRGMSTELDALKLIVTDKKTQEDLTKDLAAAKDREKEEQEATKSGERTRELYGTLTVVNHSGECLRIQVSGRYFGTVHSGQTAAYRVHDHNYHTELVAICEEGGEVVDTACVEGHQHRYVWHIHN